MHSALSKPRVPLPLYHLGQTREHIFLLRICQTVNQAPSGVQIPITSPGLPMEGYAGPVKHRQQKGKGTAGGPDSSWHILHGIGKEGCLNSCKESLSTWKFLCGMRRSASHMLASRLESRSLLVCRGSGSVLTRPETDPKYWWDRLLHGTPEQRTGSEPPIARRSFPAQQNIIIHLPPVVSRAPLPNRRDGQEGKEGEEGPGRGEDGRQDGEEGVQALAEGGGERGPERRAIAGGRPGGGVAPGVPGWLRACAEPGAPGPLLSPVPLQSRNSSFTRSPSLSWKTRSVLFGSACLPYCGQSEATWWGLVEEK